MAFTDFNTFSSDVISYAEWKSRVGSNRIRHFEFGSPTIYYAAFGRRNLVLRTKIDESSDVTDFETNYKSSSIAAGSESELENLTTEDSLIGSAQGPQQKLYEFNDTIIYVGYSEFGVSSSQDLWTIKRINLDANGNPTLETWTATGTAIWDNRTSETYL